MLELLMLTPVSTVLPSVNYEAANEHFDLTLTDDCNEEADEIIDSCRRIMEALAVRIPLVTKVIWHKKSRLCRQMDLDFDAGFTERLGVQCTPTLF